MTSSCREKEALNHDKPLDLEVPKKNQELMCVLKQQKKQTGGCKLVDLRFVSNHRHMADGFCHQECGKVYQLPFGNLT